MTETANRQTVKAPSTRSGRKYTQAADRPERKLKDGEFYVAHNRQRWHDFNLIRGHVYGMYQGVLYVSGAEPSSDKKNHIVVYKQTQTANFHHWVQVSIYINSDLGQRVLDAVRRSPYDGVEFPNSKTDLTGSRPSFPTYRSKRPEFTPRLPKAGTVDHMAETVDCTNIDSTVAWQDKNYKAAKVVKEMHDHAVSQDSSRINNNTKTATMAAAAAVTAYCEKHKDDPRHEGAKTKKEFKPLSWEEYWKLSPSQRKMYASAN